MPSVLLFISAPVSPRLRYVLEEVFVRRLQWVYRCTTDRKEAESFQGACISYVQDQPAIGSFFIPDSGFLWETGLRDPGLEVFTCTGLPAFFRVGQSFDLFSLVFFLLSRYEEYLPGPRDRHGRFPAAASLASRGGFLDLPLADIWIRWLGEQFPGLPLPDNRVELEVTYDIDQPWAYLYRGWLRTLIGHLREFKNVKRRQVLWGRHLDPFYSLWELEKRHRELGLSARVFILLSQKKWRYDVNPDPRLPAMQTFIRRTAAWARVGIHPSYASNTREGALDWEINQLKRILDKEVDCSRQHFLIMRWPATYRALLERGIREDYSMGYADACGFRAGTANPFYWYDLEKEATTALEIHPFQVMDVSLRQYLGMSPEEAYPYCEYLARQITRAGGRFTILWHNSSFSELHGWGPWINGYWEMLRKVGKTDNFTTFETTGSQPTGN